MKKARTAPNAIPNTSREIQSIAGATVSIPRGSLHIALIEYCVTGDELALCLGHYDIPASSIARAVIGFTTDFIDDATHEGWTVHVQGVTRLATRPTPRTARHTHMARS